MERTTRMKKKKLYIILGSCLAGATAIGVVSGILINWGLKDSAYKEGVQKLVNREFVAAYKIFNGLGDYYDSYKKKNYSYELYTIDDGYTQYETVIDEVMSYKGKVVVHFDTAGGGMISDKTITEKIDTPYITEEGSRPNMDFDGWKLTYGEYSKSLDSVNLTLTAQYSKHNYLISYAPTLPEGAPTHYTYFDGDTPIPNASKKGYTFDGYIVSRGGSIIEPNPVKDYVIPSHSSGDYLLTQVFTANTIHVNFDPQEGTCSTTEGDYVYDDPCTLPVPIAPQYYVFDGWYDGDTKVSEEHFNVDINGTILFAHYLLEEYSITLNLDGGTLLGEVPTSYNYESSDIVFPYCHKDGYLFTGWSLVGESNGDINYVIPHHSHGDISLKANYLAYTASASQAGFIVEIIGSDNVTGVVISNEITGISDSIKETHSYFSHVQSFGVEEDSELFYEDDGFIMKKDESGDKVLYFAPRGRIASQTHVTIPECNVIGDRAFYNNSGLVHITCSSMINKVQEYAFYNCTSLVDISSTTLKSVDNHAFYGCTDLHQKIINTNPTIEHVGELAFAGCQFNDLTLSLKMMTLQTKAFANNTVLDHVSIDLSPNASISNDIFEGCSNVSGISSQMSCADLALNLLRYAKASVTSLELTGSGAMSKNFADGYNALEQVIFHTTNFVKIPTGAFTNKTQLSNFVIPNNVEIIENNAFDNSNIENLTFEDESNLKLIETESFKNCNINTLDIRNAKNVAIEDGAFKHCDNLKTIHIDSSLVSSLSKIFVSCGAITDLYIYYSEGFNGEVLVEEESFKGIRSVENIYFVNEGQTNKSISFGKECFKNCESLVDITLTNFEVDSIGVYAFENCRHFEDSHHYFSDLESYPLGVFFGCESLADITFEGTKEIGKYAFVSCHWLGGDDDIIELPLSIEKIGKEAFAQIAVDQIIDTKRTVEEVSELEGVSDNGPWGLWSMNFFGQIIYKS